MQRGIQAFMFFLIASTPNQYKSDRVVCNGLCNAFEQELLSVLQTGSSSTIKLHLAQLP